MFQPNYPKHALGLEGDSLTAVAVQSDGRRQFGIRQAASVELPEGVLVPSFLDRNIARPAELVAAIDDVCVRAGLQGQKRWSVSLPGNAARAAIIALEAEPASKRELAEIIDWKAEHSFGAPASELRLSLTKISPDREGKARYFATAVRLAVIDEYETVFESNGWQAGLILPRALSEANWLVDSNAGRDSLLISSQSDGFTALLFRGREPVVVRNVTCAEDEADDEIYRLLMFYNDRLAVSGAPALERVLLVGRGIDAARLRQVSNEALGRELSVLRPDEVGLNVPVGTMTFDELAAPAGLAMLGA
jgi:Tfp pilus assembly PilM family ATPase